MLLVYARSEIGFIAPKRDVKLLEKFVKAVFDIQRGLGNAFNTRCTGVHDNSIGESRSHDKIVLDDEGSLLEVADDPTSARTPISNLFS